MPTAKFVRAGLIDGEDMFDLPEMKPSFEVFTKRRPHWWPKYCRHLPTSSIQQTCTQANVGCSANVPTIRRLLGWPRTSQICDWTSGAGSNRETSEGKKQPFSTKSEVEVQHYLQTLALMYDTINQVRPCCCAGAKDGSAT
ncbi:hypothetical protein KC345_g51 [Hortaea werneckii]|nr:hypothetical protein KC345_g51 [Hortaea werneckii]